jgi:hypothetical protein
MPELTLEQKQYHRNRYNNNEKARESQKRRSKEYYAKNKEKVLIRQKNYKLKKLEALKQSNGIYKKGLTWDEYNKAKIDRMFPIRNVVCVSDDFHV